MILILNILNTIRRVILIHVHREKFSEPTEYGTMNTTGGIMSLYSSNTKRDHANPARHILSVQDQRQDGYFQEVHLQNITKEIVETMKRRSTFINVVRQ
jgi:hypothetical protein